MSEQPEQAVPEQAPAEVPQEEYREAPAEEARPSLVKKLLGNKLLLIGLVIGVALIVVAAGVLAGGGGSLLSAKKPPPAGVKLQEMTGSSAIQGPLVPEGQSVEIPLDFGNSSANSSEVSNIIEVTVSVSWTDAMTESRPDTMVFRLRSPDGMNVTQNTEGMSGSARLVIKTNVTDKKVEDNTRGWVLTASCTNAGDDPVGPIGFLVYVDPGNDFSAKVDYRFYGKPSK